mmetsp:Transcript_19848/g.33804  ORF Transcript_19848/g.33804 Transcript_19848/m.33804 type:complete len:668 (-) Transcript_19848:2283-4286(-)
MTQERDAEAGLVQSIASGKMSEKSGLVFRSNAAASARGEGDSWNEDPPTNAKLATAVVDLNDDDDDAKEDDNDPITLPESTHTLLFTEPINSTPFIWSFLIAVVSILCLVLALLDNPWGEFRDAIPANVNRAVKIAQYCSVFIALLMEEEIPTALYLLRRIPKQYFNSKFPELNYNKFVCSMLLRILSGYLFLLNVLLILVQASNVLDIFYDVLALQFLQQLDDIAFSLARMSVLSRRMKDATTCKYFWIEFNKSKLGQGKKLSIFLKGVYFFNLFGLLAGLVVVTVRQKAGHYTCKEITAKMPDRLWEDAHVKWPDGRNEDMILNYPYFNGVYKQDGSRRGRRPVYVEQNKFDGTSFDTEASFPEYLPGYEFKLGAKFMYCESLKAWVFTHEYISKSSDRDDSDCPWLLRSEETEVYDIEDVEGPWQIWAGVISDTTVAITCNECNTKADCNLNGECNDGTCKCNNRDGVSFLGPHCEVRLRDQCRTIVGETYNETFTVIEEDWAGSQGLLQAYNRPRYLYTGGVPGLNASDLILLTYSGNRWFGGYFEGGQILFTEEWKDFYSFYMRNYHAFFDRAYDIGTYSVSDVTTGDTPVNVDFYLIGEKGEQFGPFGVLYPAANETGRGYFRCSDPVKSNTTANAGRHLMSGGGFFEKYPHLLGHKMKKP